MSPETRDELVKLRNKFQGIADKDRAHAFTLFPGTRRRIQLEQAAVGMEKSARIVEQRLAGIEN